jgi:GNAT superfamily N-acetyltransferase
MAGVRRAVPGDRSRAVRTATRAFADDPLVLWFLADRYDDAAPVFFGTLFDMRVDDGEVWVTDDAVSIAQWNPPGGLRGDAAARDELWRAAAPVFGQAALGRFMTWDHLARPLLPAQPYWYLGILATHPDWQRQGLARAVLHPVGARADAAGEPMFLETATLEDVAYYTRFGFTVTAEVDMPDAGPRVWLMWRDPGAAEAFPPTTTL